MVPHHANLVIYAKANDMKKVLRDWQKKAINKALDSYSDGKKVHLIVAVTGGGKTTVGEETAGNMFDDGVIKKIVVVCPSIEIKNGWNRALSERGLKVTSDITNIESVDLTTYISTYQGAGKMTGDSQTLLILDEVHHAERDEAWGREVTRIHKKVKHTLALTGTPWMTNGRIALLDGYYQKDGTVKADTSYTYRQDLGQEGDDRGTVPVRFIFCKSSAAELINGERTHETVFEAVTKENISEIADPNDRRPLGPHVAIANNRLSNNKMARNMLDSGVIELSKMQTIMKNRAKGLVACRNIKEARRVADYMNEVLAVNAEVIASDDDECSARLRDISNGTAKNPPEWIVSVGMVSEGVDIPEIKVTVYLSAIMTLLFLIQLIGRAIRRVQKSKTKSAGFTGYIDKGLSDTMAVILMPAHPFLVHVGHEIEKDVAYAEQQKKEKSKREEGPPPDEKEYSNDGGDQGDDVMRGFVAPHDVMKMLSLVFDDTDALEVIDESFKEWIIHLCSKDKADVARRYLLEIIEENDIDYQEHDEFGKELSYDVRTRLAKKEAQRVTALIRFSHPRFKILSDDIAFSEVRKHVSIECFREFKPFKKLSLENKELWCEKADSIYREGRNGY